MTKRILFVDASPVTGGAQRSLLTLMSGLDDAGYGLSLLTADRGGTGLAAACRERGLPVGTLSAGLWRRSLAGLWQAGRDCVRDAGVLRGWLRQHPCELLYANGLQSAAFTALTAPLGLPLVFHHRDCRAPAAVLGPTVRRADLVVAVSEFTRQSLLAACPGLTAPKLRVVYNGVAAPLATVEPATWRQQHDLAPTAPLAIIVADFVAWKNHALFLRAVADLKDRVPGLRAVIAGQARDAAGRRCEAELRDLAGALGIAERVVFAGHVESVGSLFATASVCVSAAVAEPFGRTVIEALAWGCPLVVVKGGGPEEITRGCAAVRPVEPEPHALADAMAVWLATEPSQLPTASAREWAAKFTPAQHVQGISQLLDGLPQGHRGTTDTV